MNVTQGLTIIKEKLLDNDAAPESLAVVDAIMQRASLPAAQSATAPSLLQLVRMLARTPQANANPRVYDDFIRVEAELEVRAEQARIEREAEDAKPLPKSRKFYKQQKEREKRGA